MPNVNHGLSASFAYDGIDDAFPSVDPHHRALGNKLLVQLRRTKRKTKGGLILAEDSRESDQWNTQVAKVIDIGPVAFCSRATGEPWPEGKWVKVGDFVRIPKFRTDMFQVRDKDGDFVLFCLIDDLQVTGQITGDPTTVLSFI